MIPRFLRPEILPFASVEILTARLTDTQPPAADLACAWCTPPHALVPGASHGICRPCSERFEAGLR